MTGQIKAVCASHNAGLCYVDLERGEYILRVDFGLFCDFFLCICSFQAHVLPFVIYAKAKAQYCLLTSMSVLHYLKHVHQTRECMCNSEPEFVGSRDH